MTERVFLDLVVALQFGICVVFLLLARPTRRWTVQYAVATGWVWVAFISTVRAVFTYSRHGLWDDPAPRTSDTWISVAIGMCAVLYSAFVLYRLLMFRRMTPRERSTHV